MAMLSFVSGLATPGPLASPPPTPPQAQLAASSLRGNNPARLEAGSGSWSQLATTAGAILALAGVATSRRRASAKAISTPVIVAPLSSDEANAARAFVGQPPAVMRKPVLAANRGMSLATVTGRGSRIVTNVKIGRGPYARYRRRALWLDFSKNFKGRRRNCQSLARRAVMKALKQKYKSRRLFKRERRTLWIMRVRANSRLHGIAYSRLICKLKEANININRKILSQLGVYDRAVFTNILQEAIPNWKELKEQKEFYRKPKTYTVEQIDNVMIPHIEKIVPEIYEDDCIRFNRKVHDWGVEYTIDQGDPKVWQQVLPKMPELQNFELPDHWLGNANAEKELTPLELVDAGLAPGKEQDHWWKFIEMVKKTREEDAEKAARGEPTWPKKEGVSRADWFKEEPQSWFD